ncbi:MAG: protein-glutamate O-methyltransferase CheR [Alphaproteobacteria bacterium]|nr:protein-glutamate O-methyltransferase CheR [Alphaproteobacteria bacterium]
MIDAIEGEADSIVATTVELPPRIFSRIAEIVRREARIELPPSKITLVQSRLARRLRERQLESFGDYIAVIESDAEERAAMIIALTTNHTHFFRENHHFEHLRETVVPMLRERALRGPVRIWSAGCSSGQEIYSIAMCLLGKDRASAEWLNRGDVKLLATDLSPPVIEATRRAVYSADDIEPVPPTYRRRWLLQEEDEFAMSPEARRLVTARVLNLFGPWPMTRQYDVIFCRNVMIYFDASAKAELEARFVEMLTPGGYLYVGHSERLIGPAAGSMTPCGQTIYVKANRR